MSEDVFRQRYSKITQEDLFLLREMKEKAQDLYDLIERAKTKEMDRGRNRCLAVAQTNLEQSIMWATKGVTA